MAPNASFEVGNTLMPLVEHPLGSNYCMVSTTPVSFPSRLRFFD